MSTKKSERNIEGFLINRVPPSGYEDSRGIRTKHSSAYKVEVYGGITTGTIFKDSAMRGYGDDYFVGWELEFISSNLNTTALTVGERSTITSYTDKTGSFTVQGFSGTLVAGDEFIMTLPTGERIVKATTVSPFVAAAADIFTIDGGFVRIKEIIGRVTTAIQDQATTVFLAFDADSGAANLPITGTSASIRNFGIGTLTQFTGDFSDNLLVSATTGDIMEAHTVESRGAIMGEGDITVEFGATSTGAIAWTLVYESLGGRVTAS